MNAGLEKRLEAHAMMNRQAPDSVGLYRDPTSAGVTVSWLAGAFELSENTVKLRLRSCPIKSRRPRGTKQVQTLYDLKEAARYLVSPALGTEEYMRMAKRGELPPALQQTIWDALLKRQKWEENAGDLWRTGAVREIMRSVFQTLKFTVQLWADTVEQQVELSPKQRDLIVKMADTLQTDLYNDLVKKLGETQTGSQLTELPALVGEERSSAEIIAEIDEDESIESLI